MHTHTHTHSIIAVGGDGVFNEILNGLLMQTQQQSGVNTRRSRFVPVTPTVRLGIIPAGCTNSIARSVLGCKCPMVAAAQIMLGECVCVERGFSECVCVGGLCEK